MTVLPVAMASRRAGAGAPTQRATWQCPQPSSTNSAPALAIVLIAKSGGLTCPGFHKHDAALAHEPSALFLDCLPRGAHLVALHGESAPCRSNPLTEAARNRHTKQQNRLTVLRWPPTGLSCRHAHSPSGGPPSVASLWRCQWLVLMNGLAPADERGSFRRRPSCFRETLLGSGHDQWYSAPCAGDWTKLPLGTPHMAGAPTQGSAHCYGHRPGSAQFCHWPLGVSRTF